MRYRLIIAITQTDALGRCFKRMASGTVVVFNDEQAAYDTAIEFDSLVHGVLAEASAPHKSYGLLAVVDEHEGRILDTWHLSK